MKLNLLSDISASKIVDIIKNGEDLNEYGFTKCKGPLNEFDEEYKNAYERLWVHENEQGFHIVANDLGNDYWKIILPEELDSLLKASDRKEK